MRWVVAILAALAFAPAAQAATIAREGTELVYRSAPGQDDDVLATAEKDGVLRVTGDELTPGEGCGGTEITCALAGVGAVRFLTGDGDDKVVFRAPVGIVADLGPGDDSLKFVTPSAGVDAGPGNDFVDAYNGPQVDGPFRIDGAAGNDTLEFAGRAPGIALLGGEGDDVLAPALVSPLGDAIDLVCGPGADRATGEPQDRFGDGCARPVTAIARLSPVSRLFDKGRLEAPARTSVTIRRRTYAGGLDLPVLARRSFDAPAGPLRVRLRTTGEGRRRLRRDPTPLVWVFVETRTAGDRAQVIFKSRLG